MTFINKLDRDGRPPIELLDEIERVLRIQTAPVTWPIGMGRELKGIYHLIEDRIYVYEAGERGRVGDNRIIDGLASPEARELLGDQLEAFRAEVELVRGATASFDRAAYRAARQTPVFFGSATSNFGVPELLRRVRRWRRPRRSRARHASAAVDDWRASQNSPDSCSRSRPTWIP